MGKDKRANFVAVSQIKLLCYTIRCDREPSLVHDGTTDDLPRVFRSLAAPFELVLGAIRALVHVIRIVPRAVLEHCHLRERRFDEDLVHTDDLDVIDAQVVKLVLPGPAVSGNVLRSSAPLLQHRAIQNSLQRTRVVGLTQSLSLGDLPLAHDLLCGALIHGENWRWPRILLPAR